MGGLLSSSEVEYQQLLVQYHRNLERWDATIDAIRAHERAAWQNAVPGKCRLAVYWFQMLLCGLELVPHIVFHASMWLLVLPFDLFATAWQKLIKTQTRSDDYENPLLSITDVDTPVARTGGKNKAWLPVRQLRHHQNWLNMYIKMFPPVIQHNVLNPMEPFYADGVDVSIYRPTKPTRPRKPSDLCDCDCDGPGCDVACTDCKEGCASLELTVIRLFRSSFVFLGGYHALQCGSCFGPCVRPVCYDPCVGDNVNSGICRICEVDEIRLRRWEREFRAAKVARSQEFYESHPDLMRPPAKLLPLATTSPQAALAAPGQDVIRTSADIETFYSCKSVA